MYELEAVLLGVAVVSVSAVVGVGFASQARRIRHYGRAGVSPTAWLAMMTVVPLWLVYGLRLDDLGVVASNAILLLPTAAVVVAWGRAAARPWAARPWVSLWVVATAAVAFVSPIALVGSAAIVLDLGTTWPQAYRAVRSPDLNGVSLAAWTFRASTLVLWFAYGVRMDLTHLTVAAASKLAASLVVVALVIMKRPPPVAVPPP